MNLLRGRVMLLKLSKELYEKEAIIKAAYFFTDKYYIDLKVDENCYIVCLQPKHVDLEENSEKEFMNEIIIQTTRLLISRRTKNIREMIIGRALASTIIDNRDDGFVDDELINSDDILNNWFDTNE